MNWEIFYKSGVTITGGTLGYLFGGWSTVLQILLAFVAIDYVSGLLASGVEGKLSSKVGFKGIAKKVMIFALVAVGHLIDNALGENHIFRDSIIFFYLGNELLSILENTGRIGLPIPEQLKGAIDVLKGKNKGGK